MTKNEKQRIVDAVRNAVYHYQYNAMKLQAREAIGIASDTDCMRERVTQYNARHMIQLATDLGIDTTEICADARECAIFAWENSSKNPKNK